MYLYYLGFVAFTRPRRCNLLSYMYLKIITMPTYGALHIFHPVFSPKVPVHCLDIRPRVLCRFGSQDRLPETHNVKTLDLYDVRFSIYIQNRKLKGVSTL